MPLPLHNTTTPHDKEAPRNEDSHYVKQHLEYRRDLQTDTAVPALPRPRKKAKGNDHKAQPHQTNPPSDDELPHKRPIPIPEGAHILNPARTSISPKKPLRSPHKKTYIPYCPPTFQGQTQGTWKKEGLDMPTPLRHTALDEDASLPHDGPTVIVELIGATNDIHNIFHQTHNPHYGTTQNGSRPPQPITTPIPYTTKKFPRLAPSYARLFGNLHEATVKQVQDHPGQYVAIIPFGAGPHLTQNNPEMTRDIEIFLKSFGFPESDHLQVACPAPRITPKAGTRFAKPFPYLLLNLPDTLHRLLLWQQTFAFQMCGRNLAVSAINPDAQARSWVILNLAGSFVTPELPRMINALRTITTTLLNDRDFLATTNNHLAKRSIGITATERALISLSTFRLTFIPRVVEDGTERPIWKLQGMPASDDLPEHRTWLRIIRQTTFMIDQITRLEPDKTPFGCVWCKAETHCSAYCPLPNTVDWKGPIPDHGYVTPDPPVRGGGKWKRKP